jgi:hypothetical protein
VKGKKKIIFLSAAGVLLLALIVAGSYFLYKTQWEWHALEDFSVEVIWQEEGTTVDMFSGLYTILFDTREPLAQIGEERFPLRGGVRIRNNRPYIRVRDLTALNRGISALYERDGTPRCAVITNGLYGRGTDEQNALIDALLGGAAAKDRFELYFQWYNSIHELGHLITVHHGTYKPADMAGTRHMIEEEQLVNSFAVAFWAYFGEGEKLEALEETVNYILGNITPPVENQSHLDFMRDTVDNERWENFTFEIYGWFQFSIVRDILQKRDTLDLASILLQMTGESIQLPPPSQHLVYPALGMEIVPRIVSDAASLLRDLGVSIPDIFISFHPDPNMHSLEYPLLYSLIESSVAGGRLIPAS